MWCNHQAFHFTPECGIEAIRQAGLRQASGPVIAPASHRKFRNHLSPSNEPIFPSVSKNFKPSAKKKWPPEKEIKWIYLFLVLNYFAGNAPNTIISTLLDLSNSIIHGTFSSGRRDEPFPSTSPSPRDFMYYSNWFSFFSFCVFFPHNFFSKTKFFVLFCFFFRFFSLFSPSLSPLYLCVGKLFYCGELNRRTKAFPLPSPHSPTKQKRKSKYTIFELFLIFIFRLVFPLSPGESKSMFPFCFSIVVLCVSLSLVSRVVSGHRVSTNNLLLLTIDKLREFITFCSNTPSLVFWDNFFAVVKKIDVPWLFLKQFKSCKSKWTGASIVF